MNKVITTKSHLEYDMEQLIYKTLKKFHLSLDILKKL